MILCEANVVDPTSTIFRYAPGDSVAGLGGTFARATSATYFDVNGVLQTASSGTLRDAHYLGGVRTTLIELAATNLVWSCRDLRNAVGKWTDSGSTTFDQTGIDGTANSCSEMNGASVTTSRTTAAVSGVYTMSAYVKKAVGSASGSLTLKMDGAAGVATFLINNGDVSETAFTRFSFSATITSAQASLSLTGSVGTSWIIDYVQIEAGPVATSPILTGTGATTTRNADRLTFATTFLPQQCTVAVAFVEQGTAQLPSNAGLFSIGESTNEAILVQNDGSGHYRAIHRRAGDVTSTASVAPPMGTAVSMRIPVSSMGAIQLAQSLGGADESIAAPSSNAPFSSAFSSAVLTVGDRGAGTGGIAAFTSIVVYPAPTLLTFGTDRDYTTKTSDIPNPNLLTNSSALNTAPWTHAQAAPTNAAATVGSVSLSRISNAGTPNAVSYPSVPLSKAVAKRLSYRIKHDGSTGADLQLLFDATASAVLIRVDATFNANGTVSFSLATGARLVVYDLGAGAYDVFAESAVLTGTQVGHSITVYASDAGGAGLGAGSVSSFLIGNVSVEDEIPAPRLYRGRLADPGTLTLDIMQAWSKGLAAFGIGSLKLNNNDGALDSLRRCVFDGNPFSIYLGTLDLNGRLTRTLVSYGVMEQPDCDLEFITIPIRSFMYGLDRPILTTTFAGTGAIAGSLEGDANVAGTIKPRIYGWGANVTPVIVDQANVVYFVSDRAFYLTAVYDEALALTFTAGPGAHSEYTSVAALIAATVTTGHWSYAIENGVTYLRLHQAPAGELTHFGCSLSPTSGATLEALLSQLLADANVSPTTVVCDGHYPVTPAGTYPVANLGGTYGLVLSDTTTYADAIAALVGSVAGWLWLNTTSNVWVLGQLPGNATGEAVQCVVSEGDIQSLERLGNPKTPGEGIPPWQVNVNYDRFATVQSAGVATTVDAGWRARVGREHLTRSKTRSSVKVTYPLAQSIEITGGGCLTDGSVAPMGTSIGQTLADQLFDALSQGYEFFQLTVPAKAKFLQSYTAPAGGGYAWTPATMPSFRGAVLGVKSTRYGLTTNGNGTKCHVMRIDLDLTANRLTFIVATRFAQG